MLKIEHLTKTYGGKPAVQDLCLHIRPGELCAFIGHNGAGKTTTLKCCCGIQQFDAGEIYVDGISVRENPLECKRRLAYLPDDPQHLNSGHSWHPHVGNDHVIFALCILRHRISR